ncbi:hypothetical protein [Nocardia cyriacigeorgica]|uniref:hypothetical protein n=1 Tax=Nocardia cyriacigeorgica TaxID=135487 RepID=UPI0024558051|nr:hypothetical protein [Nocardia cyriacigeorgica]
MADTTFAQHPDDLPHAGDKGPDDYPELYPSPDMHGVHPCLWTADYGPPVPHETRGIMRMHRYAGGRGNSLALCELFKLTAEELAGELNAAIYEEVDAREAGRVVVGDPIDPERAA